MSLSVIMHISNPRTVKTHEAYPKKVCKSGIFANATQRPLLMKIQNKTLN
jgi:hypothetical protein